MGDELVSCHSGSAFAERPVALRWQAQQLEVDLIEKQWRCPGELVFRVKVKDGRRFELVYNERQDDWQIIEI